MKKSLLLAVSLGACLGLSSAAALAAGPDSVAKSDRGLWPAPIDTVGGYDRASRAEILVFANAVAELTGKDDAALKETLHIKSVDRASVTKVRERLLNRMRANFQAASASCVAGDILCAPLPTVPAMLEAGRTLSEHLPAQYQAWYGNAATFHRLYAGELVRLAALFPKVSSEIDTFIAAERMGTELPDGHFLWTFDDGPSKPAGTTDALLPVLEQNRIHAMFYVLGERLSARLKSDTPAALQKSYDGQCVGMHGWTHDSHQRMPQWQASVLDTQHLVQQTWPAAYRPYFRPPYGQRLPDSGAFFSEKGLTVALWNIDSQDWNAHVSERDAAQRVLTLMLTWRSGVILFHDIHTKAVGALPWIVAQTRQSGVTWDDCRRY